jgi:hypothetical protein
MPKREAFCSLFLKKYIGKRLRLLTVVRATGSAFAALHLSGMTANKIAMPLLERTVSHSDLFG